MKLRKILLFILLFIPIYVNAYGIENYYIDAEIQDNGDLIVSEYFNLTGSFNGFERIILFKNDDAYDFNPNLSSYGGSSLHNGNGLDILEVRAVDINDSFNFNNVSGDIFNETSYADAGDYGVYSVNENYNGKKIRIYNPSSENKAFYIKYRIKNMGIKHKDVGELGWNILGDELRESISHLETTVHIPNNNKEIRVWGHGPLHGKTSIINKNTVKLEINGLSAYRAIDIRVVFDVNVLKNSTKLTNVNALDKILKYESSKAEQANYERENKDLIAINNAEKSLVEFETNVTRITYNDAYNNIMEIINTDKRNEFLERIKKTKILLDSKEKEYAETTLSVAKKTLDVYDYNEAKRAINEIDINDTKEKLTKELIDIEELIKIKEKKAEIINYLIGVGTLFMISYLFYIIYKNYHKDPIVNFSHKYMREFPNNYSPSTVSYLMNGKINDNALSAEIMDLIRRKVIIANKIDKNNYELIINDRNNTNISDEKLMKLIFNNATSISTKELKKYAKRHYYDFISKWDSYQRCQLNIAKDENLYEKNTKKKKEKNKNIGLLLFFLCFLFPITLVFLPFATISIVLIIIIVLILKKLINYINNPNKDLKKMGILILSIVFVALSIYKIIAINKGQIFYNGSYRIFVIIIIICPFIILYLFNGIKRTEKGALLYKKWDAFKNFLNDFGLFKDKEVPEIVLWEKYLVYATLFGCAKKIAEVMKIELEKMEINYDYDFIDLYNINNIISHTIFDSHNSAVHAKNIAESSSSSGGGFSSSGGGGGGFSSGGGSFGGGGGGGRF